MAKKKTSAPVKPRAKKLRLVSTAPIGLTDAEQQQLRDLYRPLAEIDGVRPSFDDVKANKRIAFHRMLYIYIEALCNDARRENANSRKGRTVSLRRQVVRELGKLLGRELTLRELIQELSKHAPLPEFAADAIRRDYLAVTVN